MFKDEVQVLSVHECHLEVNDEWPTLQRMQCRLLPHHCIDFVFFDQISFMQLFDGNVRVVFFKQCKIDLAE